VVVQQQQQVVQQQQQQQQHHGKWFLPAYLSHFPNKQTFISQVWALFFWNQEYFVCHNMYIKMWFSLKKWLVL
jgi:hypothetical protein